MPFDSVNYVDVRRAAAQLAGLDPDNLSVQEAATLKVHASQRFKTIFEQRAWPEFSRYEKRFFRDEWSAATTYAAAAEVFYTPTGLYYQSLKSANTNNAPATGSPLAENSAWWSQSQSSYSADDYNAAASYVAGNKVYYPTTGLFYACHTASTGNVPTNASFWGALTDFDRHIPWSQTGKTALGQVIEVWDLDRRNRRDALEVPFEESVNGVQVHDKIVTKVWVDYRLRFSRLFGADWSSTAAYAAGDQVYYASATNPGNFWNANQSVSAGQSPDTHASKWDKISIPVRFEQYLVYGIYADWLQTEGQVEKSKFNEAIATRKIEEQFLILAGQQNQRRRLTIKTR